MANSQPGAARRSIVKWMSGPFSGRRDVCYPFLVAAAVLFLSARCAHSAEPLTFRVELDPAVANEPITGRLYVMLTASQRGEPRFGPNWYSPEPFCRLDVESFAPGESRRLDDDVASFPRPLSELPAGTWRAQAILDHDFYEPHPAHGAGNLYGRVTEFERRAGSPQEIVLTLDQVVPAADFPATEHVRELSLRSKLLSDFHGREVMMRAAVVLPSSYARQPRRGYPTIYVIEGFGGRLERMAQRYRSPLPVGQGEAEFIRVLLSGNCKWGHHVYADSATNGPWAAALVEELIPHFEEQYRAIAAPHARFLNGHSSGGWSSLWLQVNYPDFFGGVWSTAPDPVDFRDFQQVDLYADPPLSLYFDEQGQRRPIARRGTEPVLWYQDFAHMDDVLGVGGQLRSFEAVFSPLDDDGLPQRLWDRTTGRVDREVAAAWQDYDIGLLLAERWDDIGPKLQGKLHIVTGELDTYYLEGAVRLLAETLDALGSDAEIEIIPGRDHSNVVTAEMQRRFRRQMSEIFRAGMRADPAFLDHRAKRR